MTVCRKVAYDIVRLILILLVVVGHLLQGNSMPVEEGWSLRAFIYFFHMPMFFFLSGYFVSGRSKNITDFVIRIRPLICCFVFSSLVYFLFFDKQLDLASFVNILFSPFNHLWFIPSLIFIMLLDYVIGGMVSKVWVFLPVAIVVAVVSLKLRGFEESEFLADYSFKVISRAGENWVYFLFGAIISSSTRLLDIVILKYIAGTLGSFVLVVAIFIPDKLFLETIGFSAYSIYAITHVVFNLCLAFLLASAVEYSNFRSTNNYISKISENTLFVYLWHYFFVLVVFKIFGVALAHEYALPLGFVIVVGLFAFVAIFYPIVKLPRNIDLLLGVRRRSVV